MSKRRTPGNRDRVGNRGNQETVRSLRLLEHRTNLLAARPHKVKREDFAGHGCELSVTGSVTASVNAVLIRAAQIYPLQLLSFEEIAQIVYNSLRRPSEVASETNKIRSSITRCRPALLAGHGMSIISERCVGLRANVNELDKVQRTVIPAVESIVRARDKLALINASIDAGKLNADVQATPSACRPAAVEMAKWQAGVSSVVNALAGPKVMGFLEEHPPQVSVILPTKVPAKKSRGVHGDSHNKTRDERRALARAAHAQAKLPKVE